MRFIFLACLALITGCASTAVNSMVSPELGSRRFARVMVLAEIGDLGLRQQAEAAFAAEISGDERATSEGGMICDTICRSASDVAGSSARQTRFVAGATILFPGKSYSQEEVRAALQKNGIDAILVLFPTAVGASESYIPPTYTTRCTAWNGSTGCSTTAGPSASIQRPWASFAARLFDVQSGDALWISTSNSSGTAFASYATIVESVAKTTVEKLKADRIIH